MKSSKYKFYRNLNIDTEEVNKALDEIHDEMDKVVVTKSELSDAL